MDCKQLIRDLENIEVKHIYREPNKRADHLAELGRDSPQGFDFDEFSNTQLRETPENDKFQKIDELELLGGGNLKDGGSNSESSVEQDSDDKVPVEYYQPKPGDFVEVLPLNDKEVDYLLFDVERDAEEFMVRGKMGIVKNEDAINGQLMPARPVVDPATVLFAEVLGGTLSGRPLLSTRRFFRRIVWHRVRQGLQAFLPKAELMNRVNSFTELKEDEILHLQEGTLLEGTVRKIFPYGAQIRIGETNRSGLLHISNISQVKITSVKDVLAVDEKVKVPVVKKMFPNKKSLSIAELENESGLFMTNKERVFSEAEVMAKKFRQKLPAL
ncbi:S1 domain [Dillenia turbinata]|uniref:S1 domain n=1 Tax=Dillenia turbinata TaxID=194707 RepID=A0AAN8ZHJ6_9MAGN